MDSLSKNLHTEIEGAFEVLDLGALLFAVGACVTGCFVVCVVSHLHCRGLKKLVLTSTQMDLEDILWYWQFFSVTEGFNGSLCKRQSGNFQLKAPLMTGR